MRTGKWGERAGAQGQLRRAQRRGMGSIPAQSQGPPTVPGSSWSPPPLPPRAEGGGLRRTARQTHPPQSIQALAPPRKLQRSHPQRLQKNAAEEQGAGKITRAPAHPLGGPEERGTRIPPRNPQEPGSRMRPVPGTHVPTRGRSPGIARCLEARCTCPHRDLNKKADSAPTSDPGAHFGLPRAFSSSPTLHSVNERFLSSP